MLYGRQLIESRPFLTRVPDDSVIVAGRVPTSVPGAGRYRFVATRDSSGSYAMVYAPIGRALRVRMDRITGEQVRAWSFDPRTGKATEIGVFANKGEREFLAPEPGEQLDWVLVLDDVSKNYAPPGRVAQPRSAARRAHFSDFSSHGDTEIFVADPDMGDVQNLSRSPQSEDRYPCWSPDGTRIAFTSNRDGPYNLYVMDADGENVKRIVKSEAVCYMPSWQRTPDGERIILGMHGDKPQMASIKPDGANLYAR